MPGLFSRKSRRAEAAPLVFPIGHQLGAQLDGSETTVRIRRGPEIRYLSAATYAVWTMLHGSGVPATQGTPWTRHEVAAFARRHAGVEVDRQIDELLADGLAVEVWPGTPQAVEFAQSHRLLPLLRGLGNTPQAPWLYGIGLLGQQPVVHVTHLVYEVWQWSAVEDSLWSTCTRIVQVARTAHSTNPDALDPTRLLAGFLGETHTLLSACATCWDVPFRLRSPDQPPGEANRA
jgi:hypothetical protein